MLSWLHNTNLQQIPRAPPEGLTVFAHVLSRYVQSRMVYIRHVKHAALCKRTYGPHKGYCNLVI